MRHQLSGRKLGRTTPHRWALFKNMAVSLVEKGRVETTLAKARELRSFADHLVTLGKRNDLHARRQAYSFMRSRTAVQKLFGDLAPRFKDRNGGFTRIFRLGFRHGDSAPMAVIEYLSEVIQTAADIEKNKVKKTAAKPKVAKTKAAPPEKTEVKKKRWWTRN